MMHIQLRDHSGDHCNSGEVARLNKDADLRMQQRYYVVKEYSLKSERTATSLCDCRNSGTATT